MAVEQQLRQISVLIIGGGPVAQVLGKALSNTGANISLYLKPKYASVSNAGFAVYPTSTRGKRLHDRWDDFKIYTTPEQLHALHADQVYVCVGQHELRTGWLEQIWPSFRHAYWVFVQPGLEDYAYIAKTVPERFIVQGKMGFLAYRAPIGDEDLITPGVAHWIPPGAHTYFKGQTDEAGLVVANLLTAGGLRCGLSTEFHAQRLYSSALLLPFVMSLEARGWSFERLRGDSAAIARMCVAIGELSALVVAETGKWSKLASWLRKPWVWRALLKYGPRYAPIPLEAYYRTKYTSLRPQTEALLDEYARLLARHNLKPVGLADLRRDWLAMRPRIMDMPSETPADAFAAAAARTHTSTAGIAAVDASRSGELPAASQSGPMPAASQSGQFQQPMTLGQFRPGTPNPPVAQQRFAPAQSSPRHSLRPGAPTQPAPEDDADDHTPVPFRPDGQQ